MATNPIDSRINLTGYRDFASKLSRNCHQSRQVRASKKILRRTGTGFETWRMLATVPDFVSRTFVLADWTEAASRHAFS
jgi:hypothetical protein